ncbi:hypothetical protein [Mechercharimyces sp. CAU 1602]|uniref:hypothetical protein n=1 Tax=Mechercharimyces sp. CAU 1602 TaxID=2973933 RepID=UPI002161CCA2|nr:hypothetical protein [Mechercharimyces sp. CAU 1602]MCS1352238.1 hypothetical protein [Mechercharimyces sp. CAU 1602]
MEQWVLSLLAMYGLFELLLTLSRLCWFQVEQPEADHLVLITENSQHSVEWMIRSFYTMNRLQGRSCGVTCVHYPSTDDTLDIIRRLDLKHSSLTYKLVEKSLIKEIEEECQRVWKEEKRTLVLDLRISNEGKDPPRLFAQ